MSNDFYNATGSPALASSGSSAVMRAEFDAITAAFDKLPLFAGNANKPVITNSGATGLTVAGAAMTLAGNFALTGSYAVVLDTRASVTITLPAVSGALFTTTGAATLTNKTISSPTLSGTATGTYTIGGTPTYPTGTALSSPIFSGNVTGTYTIGGTPTFTSPVVAASTFTSPVFKKITVSSGPLTLTSGQIEFSSTPATPGTGTTYALHDYEEGTWTPYISCPHYEAGDPFFGDLVLAYSTQLGTYTKIGQVVHISFVVVTSTFTHTTLPDYQWLVVRGLPFAVAGEAFGMDVVYTQGSAVFKGTTIASRNTCFTAEASGVTNGDTSIAFGYCEDSNSRDYVMTTDHTSGVNVTIHGTISYIAQYGN